MPVLPRIAAALGAFLLLTSPGFAPIGARTVEQGVRAKPALWVVKDRDTTVYLFGTIHVMRPDVRWFDGRVRRAFDGAQTLVLEVDSGDQAAIEKSTLALAMDQDGPPLRQKLDAPTRAKFESVLGKLDIAPASLDPFQPWFAAVTLSITPLEKLGYRSDMGAEEVLKRTAVAANKAVVPLESVDEQLGFFAGLPEATQVAFLSATVDDALNAETEMARMVGAWAKGKPELLAEEMNDSLKDMPQIADALLYKRNARWAAWVRERMTKPGTVFMAVGAGHLAGERSLIADLKAAGLKARRVQ